MKTTRHSWRYLAKFFLEWEMFYTKVVEIIKTYILCLITFFSIIAPFMRSPRKTWWRTRGRQLRHNMAQTRHMLDKQGYMHVRVFTRPRARLPLCTHAWTYISISNTYCFSTAKMVSRTRLSVKLYVHCPLINFHIKSWTTATGSTPICSY